MKRKTDGSRRHGRIRFMLKRRQVLKMLGISATALSLPPPRRPTCWTGLKATTARQPRRARPRVC